MDDLNQIVNLLTILKIKGIGRKTGHRFMMEESSNCDFDPVRIKSWVKEEAFSNQRITCPSIDDLMALYEEATEDLKKNFKLGVKIISIKNRAYPDRLKMISDPPLLLYVKGNEELLDARYSIAIVGTREPTNFGIRAGFKLSSLIADEGFVIVSGLAKGCDTVGHLGCLEVNGKTIAVLAGGLDKIYPSENTALAERILECGGCLVSEHSVGIRPRANFFVERDRIQSGLSQAVIVLETGIKGGTLHTVGFAIQQNRVVACLGGHPKEYDDHDKVQGNKLLISKGARRLSTAAEIAQFQEQMKMSEIKNIQRSLDL